MHMLYPLIEGGGDKCQIPSLNLGANVLPC